MRELLYVLTGRGAGTCGLVCSGRNVYYLKLQGGEWKVGTIISNRSVRVISFSEDVNVRLDHRCVEWGLGAWYVTKLRL